jgi:PAS domain S-box-containing protein
MPALQNEDRPDAALVRQLHKHAPIGIAATLLNSSILVFIQWRVISHPVLLTWLGTITLVTCVRYGLVYRLHRLMPHQYEPGRVYTQLMLGMGLSGVLWGSAGIFLFATDSITHQVFLAFVLGGMVAGAAGTYSTVMRAFFAFSVPALTPLIMRFLIIGDEIHFAMGGMTLLYWFMMYFTARRLNATTIAIFRLNVSLAEEKERAESINEELKVEIGERIKVEEELRQHRENLSEMVEERTAEVVAANAQLTKEIEERKRAQEAQRQSEQKFRTLVETTSDVVWEMNKHGVFTYVSPKILEILGYSPDEVVGRRCFHLMPPAETRRLQDIFASRDVSRRPFNLLEIVAIHKDGHRIFSETSGVPVFDDDGELRGYRGISRDISARKEAEEQLRESEEKYRHLVENISDVIYTSNEDGIITYASPTVAALSGYQPAEIIGRHFTEFIHPADLKMVTMLYERVASGQNGPAEYRISTAAGKARWIRSLSKRLIDGDRFVGLQGVLTDITYRKEAEAERDRLEAQLRQAQKLEALGTLAGGIAHDFNNILAAIIGYTEMMLLDASETNPMHADLQQVLKAAGRARDLVKQILVFSRMKDLHEKAPTDVAAIVRDGVSFMRGTLPSTIDIREDIAGDPAMVLADPSQIHQALINLCTNAAHAMEEDGGVLTVTLQEVKFDQEMAALHPELQATTYVRLTVKDTGHGMDPATVERIFDPYFTTKKVGKGSGLGLAVVHGIVRRHQGAITVYSEVGSGTTFHMYIPKLETKVQREDAGAPSFSIRKGRGRVLLVDDEPALAAIGQRMLGQLGYDVVAKTSSIEALETFRSQPDQFDLVVTDFTMPGMTGASLATEVLSIRPDIPVILCTGFNEKIDEEKAGELGITEFVLKPLNMHVLQETLSRALGKVKP